MSIKQLFSQRRSNDACEVHGHQGHHGTSGNRMLVAMVLAFSSLIFWHVWSDGPASHLIIDGEKSLSYPELLVKEFMDLLFNKKGILGELREVLPYFLVGILIAGYVRTYKIAVKLQSSLKRYGVVSVFLASFVGIITPLCACGTLTTAISLLFAGVPLAPVMSLMVTSSLLSPSTYLITLSDLGSEWTVVRTVSAYAMGLFAGLVTHYVCRLPGFGRQDIFVEGALIKGDFHDDDYPDERLRCNCRRNFGNRVAVRTGNKFVVFLAKTAEMIWPVGKYILVGVFIGAVVERYMPSEWVYRFFGDKNPFSIVWVTLASVPMFLHQISASSILSHIKSSLSGTLDSGAALAFMIGGPVTAVPTMVMFWTFFKKRIFALYMFVCLGGTLLISYTFQLVLFNPGVDLGNPLLKGVGYLSGGPAAIVQKHEPNLRMVMDPAGKGAIAAYSNDLEGKGYIVFDASSDRFSSAALERYDNRTYLANIASWLDQGSSSPTGRKILVYAMSDVAPENDVLGLELRKLGYTVKIVDRAVYPHLTDRELAHFDQLWLMCGRGENASLSETEIKLVTEHNARGKGMLVVAAPAQPGDSAQVQANLVASRFGATFSGYTMESERLHVSVASNLINRASELLGQALKVVKKA